MLDCESVEGRSGTGVEVEVEVVDGEWRKPPRQFGAQPYMFR